MNKINKKLIFPTIAIIVIAMLSYWLPQFIVDINKAKSVKVFIDDIIPLYPPALIVYLLAYLQWALSLYVLVKKDTLFGKRITLMIIISSIIAFLIYTFYPTYFVRPNFEINSFFTWLLSKIYIADKPLDAFPSFHCLISTLTIIIINHSKDIDKKYKIINIIFSILVYVSALLIKQHSIIDVPAGILLALICYFVSIKIVKE